MEFVCLPGQKLAQNRSRGYGSQEVARPPRSGLAGGVKSLLRVIQSRFHKNIKGQGSLGDNQAGKMLGQGGFKGVGILFQKEDGGEVDGLHPQFTLRSMRLLLCVTWLASGWAMAQTGTGSSSATLSDLPSAEAKPVIPGLDEPAPTPDLSGVTPAESPSIPQLRPPATDAAKAKATDESDWAAQAMLQKKEEARKRQEEEAVLAAQKAKEAEEAAAKDKLQKENQAGTKTAGQPAVAESAVAGFGSADTPKLPAVTGLDGVKPRAMAAGDGRVQPGFDSFTGPSSSNPMGKDFQSGAKPIMLGSATSDGRMQMPPKAPEVPSGSYKRISQDPYSLPPGYGEKKQAAAPVAPKPAVIQSNPPIGNPKRVIDDTRAGYSPYDNAKTVPDPRSQRRF